MADGNLTTLLSSGIDAFNNLWDVLITFPTNVSNSSAGLALVGSSGNMALYSVRANDFTPPELDVQGRIGGLADRLLPPIIHRGCAMANRRPLLGLPPLSPWLPNLPLLSL